MASFRKDVWDPVLIISQVLAVQSLYYIYLGLLFFLLDWLSGHHPSVDQYFDSSIMNITYLYGVITVTCFLLASLIM